MKETRLNKPLNRRGLRTSARFLALYLSLALSLPNPAFALRQTGLEEQTDNQGKPVGPKAELVSTLIATPSTRGSPPFGSTSIPPAIFAAGMEEGDSKARGRLLKWGLAALVVGGALAWGAYRFARQENVPPPSPSIPAPASQGPQELRELPLFPGTENAPDWKPLVPSPSRALDAYYAGLVELSGDFQEQTSFPFIASTDARQSDAFLQIRKHGGTVIGVSSQFNFSLAAHAEPSTYVILDTNPVVTEILVPFFGHLIEHAKTRREFMSQLLGVELEEDDIRQLLEPKAQPGTMLVDDDSGSGYLREKLEQILKRSLLDQRKQWYEEHLRVALDKEILTRLHRVGRLERLQQLEGFTSLEYAGARYKLPKRWIPVKTLRFFLYPDDELLRIKKRNFLPSLADVDFLGFLAEHAKASWSGHQHGGWLSSEENYRRVRQFWMEGRFVGMTADLADPISIARLGRWLQKNGKEKVSVIYTSNVAEWLGPEQAPKMYKGLSNLPLKEDTLILLSDSVERPKLRGVSYRSLMTFFERVAAGFSPPEGALLFRTMVGGVRAPGTGSRAEFYHDLAYSVFNYHAYREEKITGEARTEYKVYKRLTEQIEASEGALRQMSPEGFTKWVQAWAQKNKVILDTNTPQYRAYVWNLVDAGIVRHPEGGGLRSGMEEKGTPAAGLKALLEYVAQEDVIGTIALLAESGKTGDVTRDFPALEELAKKAGFAGGVSAIFRTVVSGEAVIGVPAEYAAQGIPIYVKEEWQERVRQNLSKLEAAGSIRFVGSVADAFLVIGDKSVSVRPNQVFIRVNEGTVSQVTPHLLQQLQLSGLLKAGSVVMLYTPLKDSVLVFA